MIYPARYLSEPRKRAAYTEACDMIVYYRLPLAAFNYDHFNVTESEMVEIWSNAEKDMIGKSRYCIAFG